MTDSETPDSDDELLAALTLSLAAGVGPKLQAQLLSEFGSPRCVLDQPYAALLR